MNVESSKSSKNKAHDKRWLSVDFENLVLSAAQAETQGTPLVYDVVIVGSGYGGAMAAATLAKGRVPITPSTPGQATDRAVKLCVLERGQEYLPGSFPSKAAELANHVRVAMAAQPHGAGNPQGLFDVRLGADACALVANGLGGGSLINGAVMLEPDFTAFDSKMPRNVERVLTKTYLPFAKKLLGATRPSANSTPEHNIQRDNTIHLHRDVGSTENTQLDKTKVLKSLSPGLYQPAALTIEMQGNRPNAAGVTLNACTLCGDCMTGCNMGARESLDTNLLVEACKHGAEVYTGASVLRIQREEGKTAEDGLWVLEVVYTNRALRERECHPKGEDKPLKLRTRKLILAAGTLGSTEILLRSRTEKLAFSDRLGTQFSGNGDNLAALYKTKAPTHCVAEETQPLNGLPDSPTTRRVGPTITGMLKVPGDRSSPGFVVQEFATPAPLKGLFEELLTTANVLHSLPTADWKTHSPNALKNDPLAVDDEVVKHAMVLGLIGHDAADGQLRLTHPRARKLHPTDDKEVTYEGQLYIDWPDAPKGKALDNAFESLTDIAKHQLSEADGKLLPNPLWRALPKELDLILDRVRGPVLTVHPLGGCPMGDSRDTGVVDSYGRVYLPAQYANEDKTTSLLVLDGAMVPGSLGANPSLTIAALSLRAARHWAKVWQWKSNTVPASQPKPPVWVRPIARQPEDCTTPDPIATKIQIIERLHGPIGHGLHAELTFGFAPTTLKQLTQPMQRRLPTDPALRTEMPCVNRLRVFQADDWVRFGLNCADDPIRERHAVISAELEGHLDLLGREDSYPAERMLRAGWAYFLNRGFRDLVRFMRERKSGGKPIVCELFSAIATLARIATRAGEVRYFNYAMKITRLTKEASRTVTNPRDWHGLIKVGDAIEGRKRFTYAQRSNPWNQLLYLTLTRFPMVRVNGMGWMSASPQLKLDAQFLARQGVPLVRITAQENQPTALVDLARFGLFGARMFFGIHLWSFRKPDAPSSETPHRLPGSVEGLPPPEIREIELAHDLADCTLPVRVRLTRYARRDSVHPPLVLIHGFSASGTSFAHPALSPSMASYFWSKGRDRDIWIVDLRTSPGMPTAQYPWSFEDVAWADIPVAIDHIVKQVTKERWAQVSNHGQKPVQVDVFAHCIGAVMLSMALLTDVSEKTASTDTDNAGPREEYEPVLRVLPNHIHKVVLSQKSFALNYSDANVLRAYLMRYLRRLVLPENYSFRPPAFPSLRDKLMDVFLAALPYGKQEYDRENPPWWQCLKRTPWLTARHRMDALYEHTFNVNNMSDQVLEAIDDQFGPINTETIAQIIHFTRFNLITNKTGRSIFVSLAHLARWPQAGTLGIHNAENRMVDANTLTLTEKWMNEACVPYKALSIPGAAHQDGLIGLNAELTFRAVDAFLSEPAAMPVNVNAGLHRLHKPRLGKPWFGPRIHRLPTGEVTLLLGAHPGYATSIALLLPVKRENERYILLDNPEAGYPGMSVHPNMGRLVLNLQAMVSATALKASSGVLAVVYYANFSHEDWTTLGINSLETTNVQSIGITTEDMQKLLDRFAAWDPKALDSTFVDAKVWRTEDVPATGIFAFGSCQYPAGILDKVSAEAAYERLNALVSPGDAHSPQSPEALLLLGDQIYADLTAGLLDPVREDDRYRRPYEDLLQIPALQSILRKIPVNMMPDDHEMIDNWEPGFKTKNQQWKDEGLKAYWQYQRMDDPKKDDVYVTQTVCGFALFMADSRTDRTLRTANIPGHIMGREQLQALQTWLLTQQCKDATAPKFVACAAMVLPRHVGLPPTLSAASGCLSEDAWDGYPNSLAALLGFIAEKKISGVVFLSGDAHLGNVTEVTVGTVKLVSIHAPALYAPFPFANAKPSDFANDETFTLPYKNQSYACTVSTQFPPAEDGFVTVRPFKKDAVWRLDIQMHGVKTPPWSQQINL